MFSYFKYITIIDLKAFMWASLHITTQYLHSKYTIDHSAQQNTNMIANLYKMKRKRVIDMWWNVRNIKNENNLDFSMLFWKLQNKLLEKWDGIWIDVLAYNVHCVCAHKRSIWNSSKNEILNIQPFVCFSK